MDALKFKLKGPLRQLRHLDRIGRWWLIVPIWLAWWLYLPSLHFPLIYDTLLHTQIADDLTWFTVWVPNERFGFYRPLVFVPMIAIRQLFGGYPPLLLRTLNIGQHLLNVALLIALVRRLGPRWPVAAIAGTLLATFPFSYQALMIYGNNAYLTVTGLVLVGLHLYLRAAKYAPIGKMQLWPVIACFITAVLVHELAILLLPLIVLYQLLNGLRSNGLALVRSHVSLIIIALFYLLIYFALPTGNGPQLDYGGNALEPKLLLFAQMAAYPFTWFAHRLPHWSAPQVIVFGALLTFGAWGPAFWSPYRRLFLFGLGWWLGSALMVGMLLPTYYIADGARLLYFGGGGLALCWAAAIESWRTGDRRERSIWLAGRLVAISLLLLAVWTGQAFVRQMLSTYELATEPIGKMTAIMQDRPTSEALIVVNMPQWVSRARNTFALGTEFAPVLGEHLFAAELIKSNLAREHPVYTMFEPGLLADTNYNYGVYTVFATDSLDAVPVDQSAEFVVVSYQSDQLQARHSGRLLSSTAAREPLAQAGPLLLLSADGMLCDGVVEFVLTLELPSDLASLATTSLFVQVLDANGALLAQADGAPLGIPAHRLPRGRTIVDIRQLAIPQGQPVGIMTGLYDFTTGERLSMIDATGVAVDDQAWFVSLENCHQAEAGRE